MEINPLNPGVGKRSPVSGKQNLGTGKSVRKFVLIRAHSRPRRSQKKIVNEICVIMNKSFQALLRSLLLVLNNIFFP
jgi:hypothetical protein